MLYKYKDYIPKTGKNCLTAEGSKVIGNVKMGDNCSIWYNAVIRGDIEKIEIGDFTNVQENSALHVDHEESLKIGSYVTIGHNAVVHACNVGDNCLIGMNATILSGAAIGDNCIIGAGALVPENKEIPEGSLVLGVPAKVIRNLSEEEKEHIHHHAVNYAGLIEEHRKVEKIK
jgi:carbonic anhydrase/acetyltransferase-like protein (isoleucine patch superfamily)